MAGTTISDFSGVAGVQETPEIHELRHGNALEAVEVADYSHKFAHRLTFLNAARELAQGDQITDVSVLDALSAFAEKTAHLLLADKSWPSKGDLSQFISHLVAFSGEQETEVLRGSLVARKRQVEAVAQYRAHALH